VSREIVLALEAKTLETIERTEHLISLVPQDLLAWRPSFPGSVPPANDLGHVLGHLLDCLSGFCAVLHAAFPVALADFLKLKDMSVNEFCRPDIARERIQIYAAHIQRGFQCCSDEDLSRRIATVFVPAGEPLLTLLLGNLEHLINHKYQLFFYLKLAGVAVSSRDIYQWRGAP
jgi:hypothetical protein